MAIQEKFLRALEHHRMADPADRILVAVSGGPDSVALLHLFLEIRQSWSLDLSVAHLHHGLRGREADEDQALVQSLAEGHRLACFTGRMRPQESPGSPEEYSRGERYRFLRTIAERTGARRIALGHQQNDQAETLLLRLLRGSGRRGLSGIHPVWEGLLIRPLLEVSREEILQYLHAGNIPFREDSSNRDRRFTRNRIRHDLIPGLLREFHPGVIRTLARTAERLREEDDLLERFTERELALARTGPVPRELLSGRLESLPGALQRRVFLRALQELRGSRRRISSRHIDALLALIPVTARGKRVSLPGGWRAVRNEDRIVFRSGPEEPTPPGFRELLPVPGRCDLPQSGMSFRSRILARERFRDHLGAGGGDRAFLDADRIRHPLVVRGRRQGDRFRPFGGVGEQKLKKFFINRKIPATSRDRWPLVTCGEDIVWVVGQQIDHRYRVRSSTRNILILNRLSGAGSANLPATVDS